MLVNFFYEYPEKFWIESIAVEIIVRIHTMRNKHTWLDVYAPVFGEDGCSEILTYCVMEEKRSKVVTLTSKNIQDFFNNHINSLSSWLQFCVFCSRSSLRLAYIVKSLWLMNHSIFNVTKLTANHGRIETERMIVDRRSCLLSRKCLIPNMKTTTVRKV